MTHANKPLAVEPGEPEHWFSRTRNDPATKRRAAAEWAAMDAEGKLPDGWTFQENEQ